MNFDELSRMIKKGDSPSKIELNLNPGVIHFIDEEGDSLLHIAVQHNRIDVIKLLLEKGFDINLQKEFYYTPLETAVVYNHYDSAQFLINMGCNLRLETQCLCILAASRGYAKILKLLLESGADPNAADWNRSTAAHWAAQENSLNCMRLLLQFGCEVNIIDDNDQTPLYVAAGENRKSFVYLLLRNGANVDLTGSTTPFEIACHFGYYEICNILLNAGADINHRDIDGRTTLFRETIKSNIKGINYLINMGASTECIDNYGVSIMDLKNEDVRKKLYDELY